ncbi:sugar transferase [Cognatiyoonia sp. IB215446]|uniref:sugar transferase n=1 Tax=Cognatiyoonia sp. IB215446 TaxID=3097355 RepID=UPI002A11F46E|nr:sugar transferase [Cognatiyoonia sp. IB215446]MDX8349218.1 sugar transferase [Cognatiyoonia sp. IB215446]
MTTNYSEVPKRTKARALAAALLNERPYELGLKRIFDIACVLLAAPIVLPLIGIMAILVSLDGHSPFYRQDRVGRGGQIYRIWKLRTMVADADQMLKGYLASNPDAAAEWALTQKLKRDPRITNIGHALRKSSFDELPQLWNVLVGEMSLVGPRPMMPEQRDLYPGRAYFTQRPGITGTWQVSKRNESTFADRARFDTDYVANLSFANDIKILLATVRVVLKGTGY